MTGFGRAEKTIGNKTFLVDIKSLNGKQFDLSLRLPSIIKPYEFEIRKILSASLSRGSVDCNISLKDSGDVKPVTINTDLAKAYYNSLLSLSADLGLDTSNILNALLKLPDVVIPSSDILEEKEWEMLKQNIEEAAGKLNEHRINEGGVLEKELVSRIDNICNLQSDIEKLQQARSARIKDGLVKVLEDKLGKENYDANRLEQELIYYIEKIDITEEQVRLGNHCKYFKEILKEPGDSKGKKLSFILQEIGREINTTGSKAYDSDLQKLVVIMKDELEKAKEQVLNVL